MAPEADQPSPPPTVIIAGLLRLIAAGLEPIDCELYGPSRSVSVLTSSGWWVVIQLGDEGQPVELTHAQPPSALVPPWTYGGHRDDWTLGPESRVITPVELLTAEQRAALQERLRCAPRPWQFLPLPYWDLSNLDDEVILD